MHVISPLIFVSGFFLDTPPVNTVCICEKARVHDGWCDVCGFGWIAGLKIPSKLLFTTIDHGHEVSVDVLRCESCKRAMKTDGYCDLCKTGFFKTKIYYSSFTHCLAKGERIDRSKITCATCLRNMEEGGWCDTCKRGIFGNVVVAQREHFDEAAAAFRRLKSGVAHLDKCELCGIAIYSNGMCPKCEMIYRDGKPASE